MLPHSLLVAYTAASCKLFRGGILVSWKIGEVRVQRLKITPVGLLYSSIFLAM